MSAPPDAGPPAGPDRFEHARSTFRRHLALFLGGNAALNVVNYLVGGGWWAFWPLAAWGVLFMIHYLGYKALTIDAEWVDSRTTELALKSYDRDHIENIKAHGPGAAAGKSAAERE